MAAANKDNLSQPNNANIQNNTVDSQIPDLNLEISLSGIYTDNSNQNPLDRSSTEARVLRLQETQKAPQMAAAPIRAIRLPRASSLPSESRLAIRHKDVLALRRPETKQKIAQRQMSQQPAALPEVARALAAPAAPADLVMCSASCASNGAGALDTVYHYKEEGYFTVSRAAEGAVSVQTLNSQRNVTPVATSVTAATTEEVGPSQSTPKRVKHSTGSVPQNDGDDMVSVRTTGEGGRQIEGILYARDGEVHILCVCHGLFHSPAEFIKHGGGKEVPNPLRHIFVRPSSV
ncbi:ninja-family protein AFP3-like [Pyrus ussuriensis x Pyrus communis]|uniref:Ninja-family protein n=1 Tax=Pyrus ussuriensis x Pyrus communis TaxID=2448454 RepID=A0A5N5I1I7_9ROSA|nr:ninja-family protein AFP3-like [Pyrus ussuriensis x Pyrus communis]